MQVSQMRLGPEGPLCSRLVMGAWRLNKWGLDAEGTNKLIHTYLALGLTTWDHADIYGDYTCEQRFGAALAQEPGLREQLQLVTKCGIKLISANRPAHALKQYDTSRDHIVASVENSLRQLHTDRIDVLLLHRPDPFMDADETAEAFAALRTAGKVLHFGVSNFTPSQQALLASRLDFPLVTNQIELSVLHLGPFVDGTLAYCQQHRIPPMAWSPLGGGRLFQPDTPQTERLHAALQEVGAQLGGAGLDQVALAWLLSHPAQIFPIVGSGNPERIASAAAATQYRLTREQWFRIWVASTGQNVP